MRGEKVALPKQTRKSYFAPVGKLSRASQSFANTYHIALSANVVPAYFARTNLLFRLSSPEATENPQMVAKEFILIGE